MIISGLLLGGVYAVVGSGFALVSGVMRILNFSHGALIMFGAYITYWLNTLYGVDPLLCLPLSMLGMFAFGYCMQRGIINYIVRAPLFMTLILTFGLDMVMVNLAIVLWTGDIRSIVIPNAGHNIVFGSVSIPMIRLIVFGISIAIAIGLFLLMGSTKIGKAISATRMDIDAARLVGVRITHVYAFTFGIGAALAGAAGCLLAILLPISPNMGAMFSAKAFAICILGGFGHMFGPLLGGMVMGILETAGVMLFGAGYQEAISFGILILFLVFRPLGLMGKEYY